MKPDIIGKSYKVTDIFFSFGSSEEGLFLFSMTAHCCFHVVEYWKNTKYVKFRGASFTLIWTFRKCIKTIAYVIDMDIPSKLLFTFPTNIIENIYVFHNFFFGRSSRPGEKNLPYAAQNCISELKWFLCFCHPQCFVLQQSAEEQLDHEEANQEQLSRVQDLSTVQ